MPLKTSWVRPERRCKCRRAAASSARLAEHLAFVEDLGVDAQDRDSRRLSPIARALRRAFSCTTSRGGPSTPRRRRRDAARTDPEHLQDRHPLRRPRGQDTSQGCRLGCDRDCVRAPERTAPIRAWRTRAESEPWTRLNVTSIAKSPRIEPGRRLERVGGADHLAGRLYRARCPRAPSRPAVRA